MYKEFRRANDDKWANVQRENERQPKAPAASTPAPADVDHDAANFDRDQPPTKKTRVDNSRATHDPHETFEDMMWEEYATINGIAADSAARHPLRS